MIRPEALAALAALGPRIRCIGGRFCKHAPGECTASADYQALLREETISTEQVVPIRPERPRDERRRHVDAATRAIEAVEREQPWMMQGEPPVGHRY